jgi:protein-tyrosine phosphatase
MSVEHDSARWIALDGAVNARAVVPGVLLRADNLQSLSALDVRRLVEGEGLELVLDLRTDVEVELEGPGPLTTESRVCIEHRSLYPDSPGNTDIDAATVKPWGHPDEDTLPDEPSIVRAYMSYLDRRPDSIVGAVRAIARAQGAVLVHCAAGKDRTGVLAALTHHVAGVHPDDIRADYLLTNNPERIAARAPMVAAMIAQETGRTPTDAAIRAAIGVEAEYLDEAFRAIEDSHGGPDAYLERALGVDAAMRAELEAQLLA